LLQDALHDFRPDAEPFCYRSQNNADIANAFILLISVKKQCSASIYPQAQMPFSD
jgi:hypothetical protein